MINALVQILVAAWLVFHYQVPGAIPMAAVLALNAAIGLMLTLRAPGEKKPWVPPALKSGHMHHNHPRRPPPAWR